MGNFSLQNYKVYYAKLVTKRQFYVNIIIYDFHKNN